MADKNRQMNKDWKNTVRQAQLDAAAYGQSEFGRELTAMELAVGDLSGPVQAYINDMLQLVRQAESSVGNLISVAPLIDELAKLGGQDPALRQHERAKVIEVSKQLRGFIQKHASVMSRVKKPKLITRERAAEMREKSSEYLKESESDTFRVAGHLLGRKWRKEKVQQDNSAFEKARLEARAGLWTKADENLQAANEEREAKRAVGRHKRPNAPRPAAESFSGRPSVGGSGEGSEELLSTNKEILENVKRLVALMAGDLEAQRRAAEDAARNADNRSDKPIVLQEAAKKMESSGETREGEEKGRGGFRLPRLWPRVQPPVGTPTPKPSVPKPPAPVAKPPVHTPLGGGIGSTFAFLGGAALGAAYFLAGAKAIGGEAFATNAVFKEAAKRKLEIGNKGANELRERIKIYDAMIAAGKEEAEARKAADAANAVEEKDGKWGPAKVPSGFQQGTGVTGGASVSDVKPNVETPPTGFTPGTDVSGGRAIPSAPPAPAPAAPKAPVRAVEKAVEKVVPPSAPSTPKRTSSEFNYAAFAAAMGKRESGNNYRAENTLGYIGKYQFGPPALESVGLLKPGASRKSGGIKKVLSDNANWTLKGGKEEFLSTPSIQEKAMQDLTKQNLATLKRVKLVTKDTSAEDLAGYLAASHLLGVGGVKKGLNNVDAYGTSGAQYFALAANSQRSITPPTQMASTVSPARSAGTMEASTASARPAAIVNAPQTTLVANMPAGGTQTIVVPMQTRNPDVSLAAAQMLNVPQRG